MTAASGRALAAGAVVAALVAVPMAAAPAQAGGAPAQVFRVPASGVFTIEGHGWGHGHGMSQYGAYGAAKVKDMTYQQIVAFYYPHTTLAGQPLTTQVRVLIDTAQPDRLVVQPRSGVPLTASANGLKDCVLPTSIDDGKTTGTQTGAQTVTQWRAKVVSTADGDRLRMQATADGSTWRRLPAAACGADWAADLDKSVTFTGGHGVTRLVRSSAVTTFRGALRAAFTGTHIFVVNDVLMDDYLRSVVPSEMPASWSPAALEAQAVAARTYASYGVMHPKNKPYYDIYDDTRDQMYLGAGHEYPSSTAAVIATEDATAKTGDVLRDSQGHLAFTQFSSSDGGWTVSGGQPYLPAQADPYDGLVPSSVHSWTTQVDASAISTAFASSLGQLRSIVINARDGHGQWGGRVDELTLHGSAGDVSLSGTDFRSDFGLRSEWFTVLLPPVAPTEVTAVRSGATLAVGWQPPVAATNAKVRGYRVVLQPGGVVKTVGASATSVTFAGLESAKDYTVAVEATSRAGLGDPTTVTSKVSRLIGTSRIGTAVAASQSEFAAGGAGAVVLAGVRDLADARAAAPLAAVSHAPVLLTGKGSLAAVTKTEIKRVLPAGKTVYALGPSSGVSDAVVSAVQAMGYRVVRLGGATPGATARIIDNRVVSSSTVTRAFEVGADDAAAAWLAGAAAAHAHGVVLLVDGSSQSAAAKRWLTRHPGVTKRFAIGSAAAAADPDATPVTAATPDALSVAVANKFFRQPTSAGVVALGQPTAGAVAAARAAILAGPILYADATSLGDLVSGYVHDQRSTLRDVRLVGGGLPYDDVESDLQAALLG